MQKKKYDSLSMELQERILEERKNHVENPYAFPDEKVIRRRPDHDRANLWRPAFVRDCEKIMHITTGMQIRHRFFLYIKMTIFQGVPSMYSW